MEFRLIQEDYLDDPWKILVCCILLNRTTGRAVKEILPGLFSTYPTPEDMMEAEWLELYDSIAHLGFGHKRVLYLTEMSKVYASARHCGHELHLDVASLPGCGKYAQDCWDLLVLKKTPDGVTDKELLKYMRRDGLV